MRFSHNKDGRVRNANNISKAYKITGRITRNTQSGAAMPFYRSLLLYRGLMQLEKSAKSEEDFRAGRQLVYFKPSDSWFGHEKFDALMRLKKDAAYNCTYCQSYTRGLQMEGVVRAKAWSDKWHIAPFSRILSKLMDAYADLRATKLGKETPLPPVEQPSANGGKRENAYRGEMQFQAKIENFFTSASAKTGKPDGYK